MKNKQPKGFVLLLTVIVVGVTGFSVMAFIARSGIASLRSSQYQKSSIILQEKIQGCIDEVLAQNLRDSDFNLDSVSLGTSTCLISTVESSLTEKTLSLSVSDDFSTQVTEITIGLDPIALISIN